MTLTVKSLVFRVSQKKSPEIFTQNSVSSLQRMVQKTNKTVSNSVGRNTLVNERGQRRRASLAKADRKVTVKDTNNHTLQQWYAEEHL